MSDIVMISMSSRNLVPLVPVTAVCSSVMLRLCWKAVRPPSGYVAAGLRLITECLYAFSRNARSALAIAGHAPIESAPCARPTRNPRCCGSFGR
jgi:hypothetical protein